MLFLFSLTGLFHNEILLEMDESRLNVVFLLKAEF